MPNIHLLLIAVAATAQQLPQVGEIASRMVELVEF